MGMLKQRKGLLNVMDISFIIALMGGLALFLYGMKMMSDGLAYRHDYHEQPPRVEYGLTELGTKMLPIVNSLADFGNYYKSIIEQN